MTSVLGTIFDLVLVVFGFSMLILLHELGHFVAARWAGIRVLAFALGFGKALVSYRPGLGWRRGSSEATYAAMMLNEDPAAKGISPTEYRLNALPFGGYVKMLGQDDADAGATSEAHDSYQKCKIWKRMVVISAGVFANMVTAIVLFVVVFTVGLKAEPARIGDVREGSPASRAVLLGGAGLAGAEQRATTGLWPGDRVVAVNGTATDSFKDLVMASVMTGRGESMVLDVERPGTADRIQFKVTPEIDEGARVQSIGVFPSRSRQLFAAPKDPVESHKLQTRLKLAGLAGVSPGMVLTSVNGAAATRYSDLQTAIAQGGTTPVVATFTRQGGGPAIDVPIRPVRVMNRSKSVQAIQGTATPIEFRHFLGLTPVLTVFDVNAGDAGERAGLKAGDVIARVGDAEWPSQPVGLATIKNSAGRSVPLVVARRGEGAWKLVDLGLVKVSTNGLIGFHAHDSSKLAGFVTRYPGDTSKDQPAGSALGLPIGARIVSVGGRPIDRLVDAAELKLKGEGTEAAELEVEWLPATALNAGADLGGMAIQRSVLKLSKLESAQWLAKGEYEAETPLGDFFEPEQIVLKSSGPLGAVGMGMKETRYAMAQAYLTLVRLFQGTIKVEHLQGPVGIAHTGVRIADRGVIWLLFFFAMISVNLAVLNYLPLPIVDGGHMVFLVYEWIRGKPPSVSVQNGAALVGLAVMGTLFLVVTAYNISDVVKDLFS